MTILLMFQKAGPDLKGPLTLFARRQEGLLCYEEPHDIRSKINSRPKTNPVKQLLGGFGIAITRRENAPGKQEKWPPWPGWTKAPNLLATESCGLSF
jgi:hypothetical protein